MGWKKALVIVGIVLAVLLVSAGIAVYVLSRPVQLVPYHDSLDPGTRDQQTRLALALHVAGVGSSLVTVKNGTAAAAYEFPTANATGTPDDWQRTVLSTLGAGAPNSTTLVAIQLVDGKPTLQWSVPTAKMVAFQSDQIDAATLEAAVVKATL